MMTGSRQAVRVLAVSAVVLAVIAVVVEVAQRRTETACRLRGGRWVDSVGVTRQQTVDSNGVPFESVVPMAGCEGGR